jgi:hypothetical protein
MIDAYAKEQRQDNARDLYRHVSAVLDLPIVPVDVIDGKVVPLVSGRPAPSTLDRWFGRGGEYRQHRAALIVRDTDPVYIVRGSTLRGGAPCFRDQIVGESLVSFFRQSARPLPLTTDVVRLVGYVVLPDSAQAWLSRPIPESFAALRDPEVLASQTVTE